MIITEDSAFGTAVAKVIDNKKWYICKVSKKGYEFNSDYTYARRFSKKVAEKHVKALKRLS